MSSVTERVLEMSKVASIIRSHFDNYATEVFTSPIQTYPNIGGMPSQACRFGTRLGWTVHHHEAPMSRLIYEGSGDIYQIGRVFRPDDLEAGDHHREDFMMAEWIRVDQSFEGLREETSGLMEDLLPGIDLEVEAKRPGLCQKERFEISAMDVKGRKVELCNCYEMKDDSDEIQSLQASIASNTNLFLEQRTAGIDYMDLSIMKRLPACTTGAIGMDRVVMLRLGDHSLHPVGGLA